MRFSEDTTKLITNFCKSFVSLDMVKFEAFPDLSVASWAEVDRAAVRLLQVVDAHHQALVKSAVAEAKHVTEFVGSELDNSHQSSAVELLFAIILLISPFW